LHKLSNVSNQPINNSSHNLNHDSNKSKYSVENLRNMLSSLNNSNANLLDNKGLNTSSHLGEFKQSQSQINHNPNTNINNTINNPDFVTNFKNSINANSHNQVNNTQD